MYGTSRRRRRHRTCGEFLRLGCFSSDPNNGPRQTVIIICSRAAIFFWFRRYRSIISSSVARQSGEEHTVSRRNMFSVRDRVRPAREPLKLHVRLRDGRASICLPIRSSGGLSRTITSSCDEQYLLPTRYLPSSIHDVSRISKGFKSDRPQVTRYEKRRPRSAVPRSSSKLNSTACSDIYFFPSVY